MFVRLNVSATKPLAFIELVGFQIYRTLELDELLVMFLSITYQLIYQLSANALTPMIGMYNNVIQRCLVIAPVMKIDKSHSAFTILDNYQLVTLY